ncbi:plant cysteine oxidase 2-like [Silene latifolia]|uniref:plant cysteine oxidase 2-like n=1 Tax=Silene latifolia TaxID=37657 RepID=UPI003D782E5F
MEGGLVQHKIVGHVNTNSRVSKKKKVVRRRSLVLSSSSSSLSSNNARKSVSCDGKNDVPICLGLQRLYHVCKNVFKGAGFVPPPHDVNKLCNILDSLKPEDLGLSRELPFFKPGRNANKPPRVLCTTVYECPKMKFSLVLFFLPASAVIPLHNHPEMTVCSKLLLGTMHIKAFDWDDSGDVKPEHESPSSSRLARLKADSVFTAPCDTSVLYPTSGGNIHAFTAMTPCVVLDVIGPPYSKTDGRDCSYYEEIKCGSSDGKLENLKDEEQSYAWLKEIEVPEHAQMDCIAYLGPRVIETDTS